MIAISFMRLTVLSRQNILAGSLSLYMLLETKTWAIVACHQTMELAA